MLSLLLLTCALASQQPAEDESRRLLSEPEPVADEFDRLLCAAANAVAAPFCEEVEDWFNLNDVTQTCLEVSVSLNTVLGFLNLLPLGHLCQNPHELQALCASVASDDDQTTCELGLDLNARNEGNGERRELHHLRGCFDEMTVVQTRSGDKYMRDVIAGEEILTCEAGVYTRVFANVDHHDAVKVPLVHLETETSSLTLTSSHFVLSNGQYVRAGDMKVGMMMDGEAIQAVSTKMGRRRDVVALRQDITVNGVCGTWVDSSFAAVQYVSPLNRLMNPLAASYPQFVFSTTQKLADFFVPLIDSEVLFADTAAFVMVTVSLTLAAGNLAALSGFYWFFYSQMKL